MSTANVPQQLDVAASLAGQRIVITGATGFVGKVVVEKLLWSVPDVGKLILLIRPRAEESAFERLREILGSPVMARLRVRHGDGWQAWATRKVEAVAGDLERDRLGLSHQAYDSLCQRIDRVLGSAATVTFDERLDRSLAINVHGAARTLALARDAGDVPLLHVSTCFVSGRRTGTIQEAVVDASALDVETALPALEAACTDGATNGDDATWVAAGAAQAERFGFNDIYTLTKALAEQRLARDRGRVPLAIVRPAIVESAVAGPLRGWIEAVRVADPLLAAYGRGRTTEFAGTAGARLELIPVDYVAHTIIAAMAAQPTSVPAPDGTKAAAADTETPALPVAVYQIGSSRNPITLGSLMEHARRGFARMPLRDAEGEPIVVGPARFTAPEPYLQSLKTQRRRVQTVTRWVPRRRTSASRLALGRAERTLDHLIHLLAVYQPYVEHDARYDDAHTHALWSRLSAADQQTFPFDVAALDWSSYIAETHVPGLIRFALRAETGAPVPVPDDEREPAAVIVARAATHAAEARTIFDLFAATAQAYPDVVALQIGRHGSWLRYTYRQALTTTANIAARLASFHGIGRGDRVVLCSTGCPEWVLTTLAVHRLGAVTVPLDPQWPAAEIMQAARLVEATLLCAAPALVDALSAVPSDADTASLPVVPLGAPFVPEPYVSLLPEAQAVADRPSVGAGDDLASIIFTSGTTVAPKAVPLTHANYLANVRDLVPLMQLTHERLLSVLPIHHVFEQMVGWLVPMAGGSTFSYVAEIKPAEISWTMGVTRPTVLVAVPRLLELLHNGIRQSVAAGGPALGALFKVLFALSRRRDGATGHQLFAKVHQRFGGSLRRIASGGSALEPSLGRQFQLMGFKVAEGYGMTETSPVLSVNPWHAIRFGSVGKPLPGVEIELRPPSESTGELAPGAGEVWVRGANVMAGYFHNEAATAAVLRDGWLNTGDIGFFDDDGYLHLSGRTKDVIITSAGKNVYPEEVEARYRDLPGVTELVVLGLPASGGGERVTALIVPAPGADEAAVQAAVADRSTTIPSYQQVTGTEFWHGDLPKTTTMKVKRAVLRQAVLAGERGRGTSAAAPPKVATAPERTAAETTIVTTLARLTRTRADQLAADDRLTDLGLDSLTRVELVGELEARFGTRLNDADVASFHSIQDLFDVMQPTETHDP